ncbi:MAG: helix-turn-helix domain-containing protein [Elusimicrobiota bacterium]
MRKVTQSSFDAHLEQTLKNNPALAKEYAKQFAELPVPTQLGIMRRRRWLSQETLARALRVKQPHVARVENAAHDPRLSSILSQAKALQCHLLVIPNELLAKVAQLVAAGSRSQPPPK